MSGDRVEHRPGVDRPLGPPPDRLPGSARRSSHVDVVAEGDWATTPLTITGVARDVVTDDDGAGRVAHRAGLTATVSAGRIVALRTDPAVGAEALVGAVATTGFRRAAREVAGERWREPIGQLLDDLPVAVLIAGYGALREGLMDMTGDRGDAQAGRMRDLCSGWRADGLMIRSLERGEGVPTPGLALADDLVRPDDPLAVEDAPALPPGGLRRRRRIDVRPRADGAEVDATFRDTYVPREGGEGTLHEYLLRAGVDAAGRISALDAEPRVLPWPECPLAAAGVSALVGHPVGELGADVPRLLVGTGSCTHLNDLLRSLAAVPHLRSLAG